MELPDETVVTPRKPIESGDQFMLHLAWSPATGLVRATYRAEVGRYDPKDDRFQCRLVTAQPSRLFISKHPLPNSDAQLCFIYVFCFYSEELHLISKHILPKAEE